MLMSRNFNMKSSNPSWKNVSSQDTLRKPLGIPSTSDPKAGFVAKNGSFLEKEFLSKEVSGRKVELDEVLPLEPESSATQENVSA